MPNVYVTQVVCGGEGDSGVTRECDYANDA